MMKNIAVDLGASSGRIMVGEMKNGAIEIDELHRFPNTPVKLGNCLYWDFLYLFEEVKIGLRKAFDKYGTEIKSIGVDTWGVDYGLVTSNGVLLGNPVCYRDNRTQGAIEKVYKLIPSEQLYSLAGNQLLEINTIFQLFSACNADAPTVQLADKLLFMPDLFNYFLTGVAANEYTMASTSQLLNSTTRQWETVIFDTLAIPQKMMQQVVYPKTVLGTLLPDIAREVGGNASVVAVCSHDTASAIVSLPTLCDNDAFISSGTWSLMGIVVDKPILSAVALQNGYTNEGIYQGKISFLKNITGLWIIQCLMKEWQRTGRSISYDDLTCEAEQSSYRFIIDVDDSSFVNPDSMESAIHNYLAARHQPLPVTQGDYMRLVCESLSDKYAVVKNELELCSGRTITRLYVMGGGIQNQLLNKLTAQKTGCRVVPTHVEATAIGNLMIQESMNDNMLS